MDELPKLPYWVSHLGMAFCVVIFIFMAMLLGYFKFKKKETIEVMLMISSSEATIRSNIHLSKTSGEQSKQSSRRPGHATQTQMVTAEATLPRTEYPFPTEKVPLLVHSKILGNLKIQVSKILYSGDSVKLCGTAILAKPVYCLNIIENAYIDR